jgi:hypothetical protein
MAATQNAIKNVGEQVAEATDPAIRHDAVESILRRADTSTTNATGTSLFHLLTLGSIGASIALFLAGKRQLGIFIGLWPPTFQALKAVVDKDNRHTIAK